MSHSVDSFTFFVVNKHNTRLYIVVHKKWQLNFDNITLAIHNRYINILPLS